jgi:Uma2 family endonuclease
MVAKQTPRYITQKEYLEQERTAESKSEYDNGVITAMAGASPEHAAITYNFGVAIHPHLRHAGCRGFSADLRVRLEAGNRYYYPDMAVVCGKPTFEDEWGMRSLLNPTLIVEVLSDTTERYDRGKKWLAYQRLESLSTYLLIHQDRPYMEVYTRNQATNSWEYHTVEGLDSRLNLSTLGCEIALGDVYADIEFQEAAAKD